MIKYAWVMVFFILITRQLMHVLRKKAKFPNSFLVLTNSYYFVYAFPIRVSIIRIFCICQKLFTEKFFFKNLFLIN